jgi:hypothetical protein
MVNFNQKSEEIHSILTKWYSKHYSNKNISSVDISNDMGIRLGDYNYSYIVHSFSYDNMEDRKASFNELKVNDELFNNFYEALINYKF